MSEQPAPAQAAPQWDVADRMRKALRHAGVGTQEMADYLDVSRQSVGNWINGRVEPSTQTLRLWALRCGVTYIWLAHGQGEHNDNPPDTFAQVRGRRGRRRPAPCCQPVILTLVAA